MASQLLIAHQPTPVKGLAAVAIDRISNGLAAFLFELLEFGIPGQFAKKGASWSFSLRPVWARWVGHPGHSAGFAQLIVLFQHFFSQIAQKMHLATLVRRIRPATLEGRRNRFFPVR